jgi:hypothetical protein
MPNRLAQETSPYLLQHRDNPVDWYPWGSEALERALELDRPILLSVGYSACHWCHVMERESFEDEATAAYMNEHFVCVKVDREERPDVDALYMEAVQAISGQGGWPMTVFCDPEGVPFYGGTYFPPDESRGMPSFRMVMEAVVDAFESRREELRERAPETRRRLGAIGAVEPAGERPGAELLEGAVATLRENADMQRGGFGGAPKFPPASTLELLLARGERAPVERTLDAMMAGGIYDQLGGGFARYSVDASWLVPHFEKMLYDNAQLARAYLHGWQAFGHERYRWIVEETLDWALREMRGPEGGFYSALDADSEGEEGRFYVWTPEEMRAVLGDDAPPVLDFYGVTDAGNFEGRSILHLAHGADAPEPDGLAEARRELYEARAQRVRPGLDDKRLASWNALMLGALAEAGATLGRDDYLDAARACAEFVLDRMRTDAFAESVGMRSKQRTHRLLRTYKDGEARLNAYLEDHAFLLEALLTLYEATFDARWFEEAQGLAETTIERFGDAERGGFFSTSGDHEQLIARRKEIGDHPIPSGNSAAALGLLRLEALTGERRYGEWAEGVPRLFAKAATGRPDAFAHLLRALDFDLAPVREVALIGDDLAELAAVVRSEYHPYAVLAGGPPGSDSPPLLLERSAVEGKPTAYVCENFACRAPTTDLQSLASLL